MIVLVVVIEVHLLFDDIHKPIPFCWRTWRNINTPLPSFVHIPDNPPVNWQQRLVKCWNKKVFAYLIQCWIPGLSMDQEMIDDI
jgi:hypothetical protein